MNSQQEADVLLALHQKHRGNRMQSTSEILSAIHSKGEWLKLDAKSLSECVAMLTNRRDFPTMAEDAMDQAERELVAALKSVRASRKTYNAKPLEQSRAA